MNEDPLAEDPIFALMAERRRLTRLGDVEIVSGVMIYDGARGFVQRPFFDPPGVLAWAVCVGGHLRVFSEHAKVFVLSTPSG